MTVYELTPNQKIELKQNYLAQKNEENGEGTSYGEFADVDNLVSDAEIFAEYEDTDFVPDDFFCTAIDNETAEDIAQECEKFMNEHNLSYGRYEEDGRGFCGYEISTYTDGGVNMLIFLDGRGKDMTDPDWWKDEFQAAWEAFDVDEEIDLHRQDESYRHTFRIRQSVHDFEKYDSWLRELASAAQAA